MRGKLIKDKNEELQPVIWHHLSFNTAMNTRVVYSR